MTRKGGGRWADGDTGQMGIPVLTFLAQNGPGRLPEVSLGKEDLCLEETTCVRFWVQLNAVDILENIAISGHKCVSFSVGLGPILFECIECLINFYLHTLLT